MTEIHDSQTCDLGPNGKGCFMCLQAGEIETRREHDAQALDVAMNDFIRSHGDELFAQKIDLFMTARGIY